MGLILALQRIMPLMMGSWKSSFKKLSSWVIYYIRQFIGCSAGWEINFYPYLHPSFAGALGACYRAYVVNPAISALAKTSQSGGTGRRARLKIVYPRMCGFDSRLWYCTSYSASVAQSVTEAFLLPRTNTVQSTSIHRVSHQIAKGPTFKH